MEDQTNIELSFFKKARLHNKLKRKIKFDNDDDKYNPFNKHNLIFSSSIFITTDEINSIIDDLCKIHIAYDLHANNKEIKSLLTSFKLNSKMQNVFSKLIDDNHELIYSIQRKSKFFICLFIKIKLDIDVCTCATIYLQLILNNMLFQLHIIEDKTYRIVDAYVLHVAFDDV